MVLDSLSTNLKSTLKKIAGAVFVDDSLLEELIKDIQRSLLSADCDVQLVLQLSETIKTRFKEEKTPATLSQKEKLINIVYEELTKLLGGEKEEVTIEKKKPFQIMVVGLFGAGKTTAIGKLAHYYKKRGYKVAVLGLDTYRPKAREQLQQNADNADVKALIDLEESDPVKIYNKFKAESKAYDILLIDTAGRDALDDELVEELKNINETSKPDQTLLIITADMGKSAKDQAESFSKNANITGVMITKLDGTAKAGGALSACKAANAKIKFVGVGEKKEDLESFNPKGFVGRLLGMGDLESLLEKASEAINEDDAKDIQKRMLSGKFNLVDLYDQMSAMRKMGPLNKLMDMVPGMGQLDISKDQLKVQDEKLVKWKHMMDSMTKKELEEPESITVDRIERIAKGSGTQTSEVRELLKQYQKSKKMIKLLKGGNPDKLMKKFQKQMKQGM